VNDDPTELHYETLADVHTPAPGRRLPAATQGLLLLMFGGILAVVLFVLPALIGLAAPAGCVGCGGAGRQ
jgi:hypothetical protein